MSQVASLESISSGLLLARRTTSLYPRGHRRVLAALASLREEIDRFQSDTGAPFSIDSTVDPPAAHEIEARGDSRPGDLQAVRNLLKINLIKKLSISRGVSEEEIYGLSYLLEQEDEGNADPPGDAAAQIDPVGWNHITLEFFEPGDLPDRRMTGRVLLERAAGVHRVEGLDLQFRDLPAELRGPLRDAFLEPTFLQKISSLRVALSRQIKDTEGKDRIDLIGEILRLVIPRLVPRPGEPITEQEARETLGNYVGFIEKNLDVLAMEIRAYPEGHEGSLRLQSLEGAVIAPQFTEQVRRLQTEKHRLRSLFQAAEGMLPAPPSGSVEAAEGAGQWGVAGGAKDQDPVVENWLEELRRTRVELEPLDRFMNVSEQYHAYLLTLLELLELPESSQRIEKHWPLITGALRKASADPRFSTVAAREIADVLKGRRMPSVEELLYLVLADHQPSVVLEILEEVIMPKGGSALVRLLLQKHVEREGKKAVPLLALLHQKGSLATAGVAERILLAQAANKLMLRAWAIHGPEGLSSPVVLARVLERLLPETIREAFREYFASAEETQAVRFVENLARRVDQAEYILFSGMDHGPPRVRCAAIRRLDSHPTPIVIATLLEIINRNNFRGQVQMSEVRPALEALAAMDSPAARTCLHEILRRRSGLGRYYLKEIRKALMAILKEQRVRA